MNRKLLFVFILGFLPFFNIAQSFRHPYSYYGIGELQNHNFINCQSSGGLGYAWDDSLSFSNTNPASYSNIRYTVFDMGVKIKYQQLKQGQYDVFTNYISLAYAAFGFPISQKHNLGLSFGLLPVSRIGDKTFFTFRADSTLAVESFGIQGGFNRAYLGASVSLLKNLRFGFNFSYYFGDRISQHDLAFSKDPTFISVNKILFKNYRGVGVDMGLQYKHALKNDLNYIIGAAAALPVNLSAYRETVTYTYRTSTVVSLVKDTIEFIQGDDNDITIPLNVGAGVIFQKTYKWKTGVDFKYEKWSDFVPLKPEYTIKDQWTVAIGGEFIPKFSSITYTKRIAYRTGFRYTKSYLNVYDEQFTKMSAILGLGLPIPRNLSRVNIAFEIGSLGGGSSPKLIKENFYNIYIGIQLNDIWFIKPKYY